MPGKSTDNIDHLIDQLSHEPILRQGTRYTLEPSSAEAIASPDASEPVTVCSVFSSYNTPNAFFCAPTEAQLATTRKDSNPIIETIHNASMGRF